jgi:hypothetical protein
MKDLRLEVIDWIKDSLIFSTELKIELIEKVDQLTDEQIKKLIEFFKLESNYVSLDEEGILQSINDYLPE